MIFENIKKICAEKNISVSSLEKQAGLGNGTLHKLSENYADSRTKNPNIETLIKVSNVLEVSVAKLVGN